MNMKQAKTIVALCVYAFLIIGCGDKSMPSDQFIISVRFPCGEIGFNHILRIDETGRAKLTKETNKPNPKIQAIGIYHTDIGTKKARKLRDSLSTLDKRGIPRSEPVPPGFEFVVVSLEEAGNVIKRKVDPYTTTPAICQIADQLGAIKEQASKMPIQVLVMDFSLLNTKVEKNQKLSLDIHFATQGTEIIKAINPIGEMGKPSGFAIQAVRSDIPIEEIWPEHSKTLLLEKDHLVDTKIPLQDEPDLVVLKPSQRASFSFNIPVDWESGQYDLKVIFKTISAQPDVLHGVITSVPVTLTVIY
ncbi:MAG: hypothetical protein ACYS3N_01115 [Planctomycetota bacterium]|jgi:hypothetical protein